MSNEPSSGDVPAYPVWTFPRVSTLLEMGDLTVEQYEDDGLVCLREYQGAANDADFLSLSADQLEPVITALQQALDNIRRP